MKTTGKRFVDEVNYGVYVWKVPDGRTVADSEGRQLSIASLRGDLSRMKRLQDAVNSYGIFEGAPEFISGARKISDEEYEKQVARLENGELPDEYDIPALIEEMKYRKQFEND